MSRRHWLAATMLLVAAAVAAQPAEREVFARPAHDGHRVDVCRLWSQGCGQPAADYFCELQHFERSIAFEVESDIGATAPTMTLEDRRLCDQAYCDGFLSITCAGPMPGTPGHVPGDAPYPPGVLPDDPPPPAPDAPPPPPPLPDPPAPPASSGPPWSPKDVMDARIDVQAQHALFRLLKGNPAQRVEASHLLSAVKLGMLEGVYQQDQQVPALRAQSLGTWWGKILPAGSDGVCLVEPSEKPPLIALRRGTPSDTSRYDAALIDAWLQCSIGMNVPVRPYDATAAGDPPATGAAQSCRGASQLADALQACQDWYQQRVGHCQRRLLARAQGDPELARQMELQLGGGADCASQSSAMRATCEQQAHAGCQ